SSGAMVPPSAQTLRPPAWRRKAGVRGVASRTCPFYAAGAHECGPHHRAGRHRAARRRVHAAARRRRFVRHRGPVGHTSRPRPRRRAARAPRLVARPAEAGPRPPRRSDAALAAGAGAPPAGYLAAVDNGPQATLSDLPPHLAARRTAWAAAVGLAVAAVLAPFAAWQA